MIDKVDKPDAPRYRVQATVETRGQKGQDDQQGRREEDEYSESAGVKGWQKFHTDAKNRKALKLRKQDITKIVFNQVLLQKGIVIIDTDIHLINGQTLKNAHLFSTKIDTYWKLKKAKIGQEIPLNNLVAEEYIEVSVLHQKGNIKTISGKIKPITKATTTTEPDNSWSLWPLFDAKTGNVNWVALIIYIVIVVGVLTSLIMVL